MLVQFWPRAKIIAAGKATQLRPCWGFQYSVEILPFPPACKEPLAETNAGLKKVKAEALAEPNEHKMEDPLPQRSLKRVKTPIKIEHGPVGLEPKVKTEPVPEEMKTEPKVKREPKGENWNSMKLGMISMWPILFQGVGTTNHLRCFSSWQTPPSSWIWWETKTSIMELVGLKGTWTGNRCHPKPLILNTPKLSQICRSKSHITILNHGFWRGV